MTHPEKHAFLSYNTPEKGYHETGIILNNLLRVNFFGIGFGAYLRHGAYAFPLLKDNTAYRLTFTFIL